MRRRARALFTDAGAAAWRGFVNFYDSHDLAYAASIAFYTLMSLFPLLLLALEALGLLTGDTSAGSAVLQFVFRYLPRRFEFISSQLNPIGGHPVTFGLVGTLVLIGGSYGIFAAITTAVNYAWRVETPPSFWRHKVRSFLMLLMAGPVLLGVLIVVSLMRNVEAGWLLQGVGVHAGTTLLFMVVVALVYRFIPEASVTFGDIWLGAIVTGLLWKAALQGFAWYMDYFLSRLRRIDGSIAAVVIFLVWVYVQAGIFLYGVEFSAAFARRRRERVPR